MRIIRFQVNKCSLIKLFYRMYFNSLHLNYIINDAYPFASTRIRSISLHTKIYDLVTIEPNPIVYRTLPL